MSVVNRVAFGILNQLQREAPHSAIAGLSYLFVVMCKHFKLDPRRVWEYTENQLRAAESEEPEYPGAMRAFMRNEWRSA